MKIKYPDIWIPVEKHRRNKKSTLIQIFKKARKLNYLREDIDPEDIANLYINIINRTFQPEFFIQEDVSLKDTINLYIKVMSVGIFNNVALNKINNINNT